MKHVLFLTSLIFLLSGCALNPAALALIATPTPVPEYENETNMIVRFYDVHGNDITVLTADQMGDESWLLDWAIDAFNRDGATKISTLDSWSENSILAIYMNSFAMTELRCRESREELASLIDTYALKIRDRESVDFPLLAIVGILADNLSEGVTDCSNYLDSSSMLPAPTAWCFGNEIKDYQPCYNDVSTSSSTEWQWPNVTVE